MLAYTTAQRTQVKAIINSKRNNVPVKWTIIESNGEKSDPREKEPEPEPSIISCCCCNGFLFASFYILCIGKLVSLLYILLYEMVV